MRFILAFLLYSVTLISQNNLQSGPMVGYCEMKEAMIWLQTTKDALVKIDYYAIDNPKEKFSSLFEYFFCLCNRVFPAAYSRLYLLFFLLPCCLQFYRHERSP